MKMLGGVRALALAMGASAVLAGPLVPYRGEVAGSIEVDVLAPSIESHVRQVASHLGAGSQVTTGLDLSGFPLVTLGSAVSYAANGDQLFLNFRLDAVPGADPGVLPYTGSYTITGGTGRFAYPTPAEPGSLGSGLIEGSAVIEPLDAFGTRFRLTFAHVFEGTLARPVRRSPAP